MTDEITATRTVELPELSYTIKAEAYANYVDFHIYEIIAWGLNTETGEPTVPCYGDDYTPEALGKADMSGYVKWDGCSDWNLSPEGMFHACDKQSLENLGKVLAVCWDLTAQMCPTWWDRK